MVQRGPWLLRLAKWPSIRIDGREHPIDDLGYLLRHASRLRELSVDGEQSVDLASINQLVGLEKLTIDSLEESRPSAALELGRFPLLHTLHLWSPLTIDWAGAPAVEDLRITDPTDADLEAIARLTDLDVLHLDLAGRLPALTLAATELRQLLIGGLHEPADPIRGIGSVTELEVFGLAGHRDLPVVSETCALEVFQLTDAWGLESLAGVRIAEGASVSLADCPQLSDLAGIDGIPGVELEISECPLLERSA